MIDLLNFNVGEMTRCTHILRRTAEGARSMEEVADRVVRFFAHDPNGTTPPSIVLSRMF
ncbi:MAG: hypothetical protein R3E12_00915 [Candidatus Eisenbacteria bacterium]